MGGRCRKRTDDEVLHRQAHLRDDLVAATQGEGKAVRLRQRRVVCLEDDVYARVLHARQVGSSPGVAALAKQQSQGECEKTNESGMLGGRAHVGILMHSVAAVTMEGRRVAPVHNLERDDLCHPRRVVKVVLLVARCAWCVDGGLPARKHTAI